VQRLSAPLPKTSPPITIVKQVIPLGDIIVEFDDETTAVIVERKSLSDLISSIRDGRYEEQSHRLIHSSGISRHNIIYMIEGIVNQLSQYDRDLVYATMTSLNFYKGFSVIRTSSIQDTAEYIKTMVIKMQKNTNKNKFPWNHHDLASDVSTLPSDVIEDNNGKGAESLCSTNSEGDRRSPDEFEEDTTVTSPPIPPPYCSVVKKVKKDNITPTNIGEIVLCQIPGISSVSAVAIMKKFGTIRNLIDVVSKDPNCMKDLYTTSSAGNRKLGSNIITNIRKYLIGDTTSLPNL
jgi:ERCC4-type nuclease